MNSNASVIWAVCKVCDSIVVREPGRRYGDGQTDTDDNPIWFIGDQSDLDARSLNRDTLPRVVCGCNA